MQQCTCTRCRRNTVLHRHRRNHILKDGCFGYDILESGIQNLLESKRIPVSVEVRPTDVQTMTRRNCNIEILDDDPNAQHSACSAGHFISRGGS